MEVRPDKVTVKLQLGFHYIVNCSFTIERALKFSELDGWDDWSKIPRKIMVLFNY